MKQQRRYPAAKISKKAESSLRAGHPWVYDAEIHALQETPEDGGLVDVFSEKDAWLGTGFYSKNSKIRIRVISRNANDVFDYGFWERRVGYALDYRRAVMGEYYPGCCRLIFGEADGMPGLTVDRYGDLIVSEVLSVGTERVKHMIYRALCERFAGEDMPVKGVFERNESTLRVKEGLVQEKGWYEADYLAAPENALADIEENGIKYTVDVENGQKTGFFLDQKFNRLAVAKLAKGRKVLDCFTHTGSFALNAAAGGAAHVTAVDVSQSAVDMARLNAKRNGLAEAMDFVCEDVFDLLPRLCAERADYDFVILDPPAFTKSRRTVAGAERGYKEINFRAMKLLPRGGLLATCSCSHFMEDELFRRMLASAALDAGVSLRLIEARAQSPDHPVLMSVPETAYLKFYLFQVV